MLDRGRCVVVILVDVGWSWSTNLGHDAYIHDHCLGYHHNYLLFYQLPNSNLFTHRMLFSRENPLVKSTAPGLFFHHIFSDLYCYLPFYLFTFFIFRFILPKTQKYLTEFYLPLFASTNLLPERDRQPLFRIGLQVFVLCVHILFT